MDTSISLKEKTNTGKTEHSDEVIENNQTNVESGQKSAKKPFTLKDRFLFILKFFTVEPFLLCYILPNIISAVALQKLNLDKACRADLNQTEMICEQIINGLTEDDNITKDISIAAQELVSDMIAWKQPLQSGIPALVILFVGAWSDKTGNRKALMLIPLFGEIISSIGMLLTTYYFLEWPLWVTGLVEAIPPAFSGGFSIALMGSYSYLADVTTTETRTLRMGMVAVIVSLGVPLGSSISGVLTAAVGYYGIFGLGLVLYILGFIHTYYRVHDIRENKEKFNLFAFFHPKNVIDTFSIIVINKAPKRLLQTWLIIWAHIVITGPVFGEAGLLFFYALTKYNMDYVEFSLFTSYFVLMGIIGTCIAIYLFSKLLKMHDSVIGMIATSCKVISSFVYAFGPTKGWFYAGPAFDLFGPSGTTAIRSLGTKIVEPDEVGKMCSIIGLAEAIVPVAYTPLYSLVYSNTVATFPGAFYMLGGFMTIPAFFIFLYIYITHKRMERDIVKNPQVKELYAMENEIAVL